MTARGYGLDGRVAIVSGGGHGIGRASAVRLAREGARVAVCDIRGDLAAGVADDIKAEGLDGHAWTLDVSDEEGVNAVVAAVIEKLGAVDILHSNAGVLLPGTVVDLVLDDWNRSFAVNVTGAFLLARAVIPSMTANGGGSIIITSSPGGMVGEPGCAAYAASKAASIQLTRSLTADHAAAGVRTNCLLPGWVDTGFNAPALAGMTAADVDVLVKSAVPIGRQGTPEEVAAVVAFLASDEASLVVGHVLAADGGYSHYRG